MVFFLRGIVAATAIYVFPYAIEEAMAKIVIGDALLK
jgi:hypothetical protein